MEMETSSRRSSRGESGAGFELIGLKSNAISDASASSGDNMLEAQMSGSPSPRSGESIGDTAAAGAGPANTCATIFNTINSIVGVGILSIPFCFKSAGIFLAPVILLLVAVLSDASLQLLVAAGDIAGVRSYSRLASVVFDERSAFAGTAVDVCIIVMNFGAAVAYFDVIGDVLEAWFGEKWRALMLFVATMVVILPLSLLRKINSLRFTSYIGIGIYCSFAVATIILCLLGYGSDASDDGEAGANAEEGMSDQETKVGWFGTGKALLAFPITTFAFACHTVIFPIYAEFTGTSSGQFRRSIRTALVACVLIYLVVGLFGVLSFGLDTEGDVLKNYSGLGEEGSPSLLRGGRGIARAMEGFFCISVCLTYPLIVFPLRDSLENLMSPSSPTNGSGSSSGDGDTAEGNQPAPGAIEEAPCRCIAICRRLAYTSGDPRKDEKMRFYINTAVILGISYTTAVLLPQLNMVLDLCGATMGVVLCFGLPAVMFLRLTSKSRIVPPKAGGGNRGMRGREQSRVPLTSTAGLGLPAGTGTDTNEYVSSNTGSGTNLTRWHALCVLGFGIPFGFAGFVMTILDIFGVTKK